MAYRSQRARASSSRETESTVDCGHTVCITAEKLKSLETAAFQANIALKFNVKLGGQNHHLSPDACTKLHRHDAGTMVLGADVTHPSGGSVPYCPSIAAVVATCDKCAVTYPDSLRLQRSKQEIIDALDDIMCERVHHWYKTNKSLPAVILFFRDDVSGASS